MTHVCCGVGGEVDMALELLCGLVTEKPSEMALYAVFVKVSAGACSDQASVSLRSVGFSTAHYVRYRGSWTTWTTSHPSRSADSSTS